MNNPTCSVDGCERPKLSLGLCQAHYTRQRRGASMDLPVRPRFGSPPCSVDGCPSDSLVRGMCGKHDRRTQKGGSPDYLTDVSASSHPQWKGDGVGYSGAHMRVRAQRGPSSSYPCKDCGDQAKHWSYDHLDRKGLVSDEGPYSPDPAHYDPRCVSCHKAHDLGLLSGTH